jgi:uroporphyrinogen III methyltransferase/synthase
MKRGHVYLVGGGPGDPGLITLLGDRLIREADVIIYDHLADRELLGSSRGELIYAGKQGSDHTLSQEEINERIIQKAREGNRVVRLKGGDPFIFGRGGEEAEALAEQDIDFTVVPGISSFYGAPAYAGIPVTHRDHASAFQVVTGHRRADSEGGDINLPDYRPGMTFVFLMGMKNLEEITRRCVEEKNFPPDMPAAVIRWGTRSDQATVTGTVSDLAAKVREADLAPPGIIIFGGVVGLREKLRWFDTRPLFGKTVVVTRTREQASKLSRKLRELGAGVLEIPTLRIEPLDPAGALAPFLEGTHSYRWIIFTSQNTVSLFFDSLKERGLDARFLAGIKVAVIGRATAHALEEKGILPDLVPERFVAEGLLESFSNHDMEGVPVFLPCSEDARPALKEGLEEMGARVERVHLYRAGKPDHDRSVLEEIEKADLVTVASSSTVRHFYELLPGCEVPVASIGPVTSEAVRESGREVAVEAEEYTIDGLVSAVVHYFHGEEE